MSIVSVGPSAWLRMGLPLVVFASALSACEAVGGDGADDGRGKGPNRAASATDGDWDHWDDPTRAESGDGDWDYWEGDPRDDESSGDGWDYWDDDPRPENDGGDGGSDGWEYWDDDPRGDSGDGGSSGDGSGDWCEWGSGGGSGSGSGSGSSGGSGSGSSGGSGSGSGSGSGGTFEYPEGTGSGWSPEDFSYILRLGDNGQYYIIVKDAVVLDRALDACSDFGGQLAYINDEAELEDVYDMIYSNNGPYWATWIGELASAVKVELFSREQIDKYTLGSGEGWMVQNTNNDVYIGADPEERYHPFVCEMPLR